MNLNQEQKQRLQIANEIMPILGKKVNGKKWQLLSEKEKAAYMFRRQYEVTMIKVAGK